jgi:CheY-like chemotaxis protein
VGRHDLLSASLPDVEPERPAVLGLCDTPRKGPAERAATKIGAKPMRLCGASNRRACARARQSIDESATSILDRSAELLSDARPIANGADDSQVFDALAALAISLQDAVGLVSASPLRVLVVDDCPFQQLLACALLSRWKIMPQIASDGLEAVLLVGEQEFDIVLMDVEMPVMDGLTATARIRENERRVRRAQAVPIVGYTAGALAPDEERWRLCGASAVLDKPADAGAMRECLERWCPSRFAACQHQTAGSSPSLQATEHA